MTSDARLVPPLAPAAAKLAGVARRELRSSIATLPRTWVLATVAGMYVIR
jgi:hypothetical protein